MRLASIETQRQPYSVLLGRPVLVSRSDVQSSSARARSIEVIDGPSSPQTPIADPAFKTVLLTPRGSTGRPVQIDMGNIPQSLEPVPAKEPPPAPMPAAATPPPASPPALPAETSPAASATPVPPPPIAKSSIGRVPPPAPKAVGPGLTKPAPEASVTKQASLPPSTHSAPAISPPKSTVHSEHSNYGAAEIAASRAFTRY
jgi:hypothetical protein